MSATKSDWIEPRQLPPLTGEERLVGIDAKVSDFWRWGYSDLRMNIVRGALAEFLVARAVGATAPESGGKTSTSRPHFRELHPGPNRSEIRCLLAKLASEAPIKDHLQRSHGTAAVALLIGGAGLAEPAKRRHKAMLAELLKSSITGLAAWWFDHPEVSREELVDAVIGLGLQQQAGHSFGARVKKRWAYQRAPAGA